MRQGCILHLDQQYSFSISGSRRGRSIRDACPDLAAAEQGNADVAVHDERGAIVARMQGRAVNVAAFRVEYLAADPAVAVAAEIPQDAHAEHRLVAAFAAASRAMWIRIVARRRKQFDDAARDYAGMILDPHQRLGRVRAVVEGLPGADRRDAARGRVRDESEQDDGGDAHAAIISDRTEVSVGAGDGLR